MKFPVFTQLAGNFGFQRRVPSRLPPPAVGQQRTGDGEQAGATSSFVQALGNRTAWRTLPPPPMAISRFIVFCVMIYLTG
jgi:hypothetical protein